METCRKAGTQSYGLLWEEGAAGLRKEIEMPDGIGSRGDFLGSGAGPLAGVAAFGSLAARPRAARAADDDFTGTTTDGRARFRRIIGGASLLMLVMLLLAALFAARADAEPRIKVDCRTYDTNRVDPIASSAHLHHQFGNTSTTNSSTGDTLFDSKTTSCDMDWFTTAGWFPVERYEAVKAVHVYYRAPGDQTKIRPIPKGLQLLGTATTYRCGTTGEARDTPPYSCNTNFGTSVVFPDCWNRQSLEENTSVYGNWRGECPSSHPYRLPRISYLIAHDNADGVVANPLRVSAGVDEWKDYTFMHADYFAANQPVFNQELLDLCLRDASDSETVADPRCGEGP